MSFVDPAPFEPEMPVELRAVLAEARLDRGPARHWIRATGEPRAQVNSWLQVYADARYARLAGPRGAPRLDADQVSWLFGITMFGDDARVLQWMLGRDIRGEVNACALLAFAVGVAAGVPLAPRQWETVVSVAEGVSDLPEPFLRLVVPLLASNLASERTRAQRLLRLAPGPACAILGPIRDAAKGKPRQRYDDAWVQLGGERTAVEGGPVADGPAPKGAEGEVPEPAASEAANTGASDRLGQLLAAWAETHDPDLLDVIAEVGTAASEGRPPLVAASKGELELAWLDVARRRDPVDAPRLVGAPWPAAWHAGVARVEILTAFPRDPRIAKGLVGPARSWSSSGAESLHAALVDAFARHGWAGIAPEVRALADARGTVRGRRYRAVAAALEAIEVGRVAPALLGTTGSRRGLAELWAELLADPANLDTRRVLADALTAAGDPRGEFIALQLADAASPNPAARSAAARLLEANIDTWTGGIPGVVRGARVFRRGFLVEVAFRVRRLDPTVLQLPVWRTVEAIAVECAGQYAALLDRMPLLERLTVRQSWPGPGGPWPSVRVLAAAGDTADGGKELPDLAQFPNLETWLTALPDARVAERLVPRVLERAAGLRVLGLCLARQAGVLDLAVRAWRAGGGPRVLRISRGRCDPRGHGWVIALDRDTPEQAHLDWAGGESWELAALGPTLGALERAGVTRARIHRGHLATELVASIERLAMLGIEVALDGPPLEFGGP